LGYRSRGNDESLAKFKLLLWITQARIPPRSDGDRRRILRASNQEVIVALTLAGLVNMVIMAAGALHAGHRDVPKIETAYHTLAPMLGGGAAGVFLVALLALDVSSSAVGTMAGQMIMQGLGGFRIPVWLRRLVTMAPAIVVVALGVDATSVLVVSQILLSIALPLPVQALLASTRRRDIMGQFVNGRMMQAAALAGTALVLALNLVLIARSFGFSIPGLPSAG
jgi:manganese transport protein